MSHVDQAQGSFVDIERRPLQAFWVSGSRTAAAGAGTQAVSGVPFTPTAAIAWVSTSVASVVPGGWGATDQDSRDIYIQQRNLGFIEGAVGTLNIDGAITGTDAMNMTFNLATDGGVITWTKDGAGVNVVWSFLFLR